MSESGKVVVTKSKLDGLANAINDKAKSPGPKTIAQLTQTVNDMQTDAPVTSVNGKTGDVTLSATDVSAIPSTLTGTAGQVLTKTANGQEWKDAAKELPNVTTADNGIFLRVLSGKCASVEIANANVGSFGWLRF